MSVIVGCGDIGRRIVRRLLATGVKSEDVIALVNSQSSMHACATLKVSAKRFDLDVIQTELEFCHKADIYYTVAPQKRGLNDLRSKSLLNYFREKNIKPAKAVVISTTGVYGDCDGEWVDERSPTQPQTERGRRRLDLEKQWLAWGSAADVPVVILRVPGIYAKSRLPLERIRKGIPVVSADECGFTNRIHADDLAEVAIAAMQNADAAAIFNVTDGTPGKISEYLQAVAQELNEKSLPEISMCDAKTQLSTGMLSYLSESRKISNRKMLDELRVKLRFPDFREGLKF